MAIALISKLSSRQPGFSASPSICQGLCRKRVAYSGLIINREVLP